MIKTREQLRAQADADVAEFAELIAAEQSETTGIPKPPQIDVSEITLEPEHFDFGIIEESTAEVGPTSEGGGDCITSDHVLVRFSSDMVICTCLSIPGSVSTVPSPIAGNSYVLTRHFPTDTTWDNSDLPETTVFLREFLVDDCTGDFTDSLLPIFILYECNASVSLVSVDFLGHSKRLFRAFGIPETREFTNEISCGNDGFGNYAYFTGGTVTVEPI